MADSERRMADTEKRRRKEDQVMWKIVKMWPIILTVSGLLVGYIVKGAKWDATAELAAKTAVTLQRVETEQAVLTSKLDDIRDEQTEIKRDIKTILRAVR